MRTSKKKGSDDGDSDSDDGMGGKRTDGTNASVFTSVPGIGGYAYIPHHKEPPRYIKFKRHHKKTCEFDRVFLAQRLAGTRPPDDGDSASSRAETGGAVWAMAFSADGRYLAAAGKDQVVRVFAVLATHEDRRAHEEEEGEVSHERLNAPVFRGGPVREFAGHTGEILDLTWSKNNFLLSTAMDRTVRLWHMSRAECLCAFQHREPVASVAFHPRDDRFFLAGSVDSTLRLWSIPDKSVAYSAQLSEVVTAVAFSPDGATCMAGTLHGLCLFYGTDGLKYQAQIHVRSSRGKNAKGSKITGLHAMRVPTPGASSEADAEVRVLVTSTDSRLRIYNLRDKCLVAKFKGHENNITQMRARFSDDGRHIVCGSEDKKAYVWPWPAGAADAEKDKRPYESFDAHEDMLTAALMAPVGTRRLLGGSGDPIYDLCNPPPVTLLSREEANASQTALSEANGEGSGNGSGGGGSGGVRRPEESPAYIARAAHRDGNIIVTADRTGEIKVFRQDCAFRKRRNDSWETGSAFSKKLAAGGRLGRSGSVLTRGSAGSSLPRSRRTSVSAVGATGPERILSWRKGIEEGEREGSPGGRGRARGRAEKRLGNGSYASPGEGPSRGPSRGPSSRDGPPPPSFTFRPIDEDGEEKDKGSKWNLATKFKDMVKPGSQNQERGGDSASVGTDGAGGGGGIAVGVGDSSEGGSTVYLTDEGAAARCEACGGREFKGAGKGLVCVGCGEVVAMG